MNLVKSHALFIAIVAVAACGGKEKRTLEDTATDVVDNSSSADSVPASTDTASSNSADLKPVIYFEFDQSELDATARTTLENNAVWLKEDGNRVITIEGHTDEVGTSDYNLALGERRARSTKDYLVRLGVDPKRVSIITYGEERPASGEDNLNRRSMFVATKK